MEDISLQGGGGQAVPPPPPTEKWKKKKKGKKLKGNRISWELEKITVISDFELYIIIYWQGILCHNRWLTPRTVTSLQCMQYLAFIGILSFEAILEPQHLVQCTNVGPNTGDDDIHCCSCSTGGRENIISSNYEYVKMQLILFHFFAVWSTNAS